MVTLKKINVLSVAKTLAIIMGFIGFLLGIFYFILDLILKSFTDIGVGLGIGFLGIIILPIAYAVIGFISGGLFSFLYNFVSNKFGGIKLELDYPQTQVKKDKRNPLQFRRYR